MADVTADKDTYRTLTTAAVLLVAAIAAAISFVHIESLAIRYGQPVLAAWLLPVSIDGTVAVSSLAMLRSARLGLTAPWLARTMLLLAVAATLACNVAYGLPHGVPGALLSGWPAVAFVGSAEVAISMSRRRPPRTPVRDQTPDSTRQADTDVRPASATRTTGRTSTRTPAPDTRAVITAALTADPDITTGQLAAMTGLSDRTVRRVRAGLNGAAAT